MTQFQFKTDVPNAYEEKYVVRTYQTSMHQNITIAQLLSFFQEIAGSHTEACGVGWKEMVGQSLFWALSRVKIKVLHWPSMFDEIRVRTWSTGYKGMFAHRDFLVLGANGKEMVHATTMWIMVNIDTRRPCRISDYMDSFPKREVRLFDKEPIKIASVQYDGYAEPLEVGYTELDVNKHLNNTNYVNRILNDFGVEFHGNHTIEQIEMNFIKEARQNDSLSVGKKEMGENEYYATIKNQEDVDVFRAKILWCKIS